MDGSGNARKGLSWTSADGKALSARPLKVEELDAVYEFSAKQLKANMAGPQAAKAVLEHLKTKGVKMHVTD